MAERKAFDFVPAAIDLAEHFIQTPLFDSELDAYALRARPETLPAIALSERSVMLQAVLHMTAPYAEDQPTLGYRPLTSSARQEIIRRNAQDLRLIGRQLIVLKNLEAFVDNRQPPQHMQTEKETRQDGVIPPTWYKSKV